MYNYRKKKYKYLNSIRFPIDGDNSELISNNNLCISLQFTFKFLMKKIKYIKQTIFLIL